MAATETPACSTSALISFPAKSSTMNFELPKTSDTRRDDTNIAFQGLGEGRLDLMFVKGWTESSLAGLLRRLSSFSRVIPLDFSDRVPPSVGLTFGQQMNNAVMQGAGPKQRGGSEEREMPVLPPATQTIALVIVGMCAKHLRDTGYSLAPTEEERERLVDEICD
jgi:hypothetical protein